MTSRNNQADDEPRGSRSPDAPREWVTAKDAAAHERISALEAERRSLMALSIGYDQLLDTLVRTRRYRLAQAIGQLIEKIPVRARKRLQCLARATGAKGIIRPRSEDDRTEIERRGLQQRLHAKLFADATAFDERRPPQSTADLPAVSVVSVLYNSRMTIVPFLQAFYSQDYGGQIEIVLVDDASSDDGPNKAAAFAAASHVPLRSIKILRQSQNAGNCVSRNAGVAVASGQIICILDADCIVNAGFVAAHVAMHERGHDAVIGPMGIETLGEPVAPLMAQLLSDPSQVQRRMRLQDPANLESATNCVTRNFSLSRRVVEGLGRELFDGRFTYRNAPDTGYGWEDVEMGAALRRWGARVGFAWNAISIHVSHGSSVSDRTRALGSSRNFVMLIETHPQLLREARDWSITTADRIASWVKSAGTEPAPGFSRLVDQLKAGNQWARPSICLYTAIAGGYNPSSRAISQAGVDHYLFSDGPTIEGWKARSFDETRGDPVRTAKKPKVLPHLYFADADWSIWTDANITLLADPRELVAEVEESGYLIGAFQHPERDCAYDVQCAASARALTMRPLSWLRSGATRMMAIR
jgi:GT2 family glycosyltransferase